MMVAVDSVAASFSESLKKLEHRAPNLIGFAARRASATSNYLMGGPRTF